MRRIRVITRKYCYDRYYDAWIGLPEGVLARLFYRYSEWLNHKGWTWAFRDARACGLREGELYRWWMIGYWIAMPMVGLHKIGTDIPNYPIERRPGDLVTI